LRKGRNSKRCLGCARHDRTGSKPNAGYTGGTVGAGVPRRSAVQRIRESLDLTEGKGGVGALVRRVIGGLQVGDWRSEVGESDLEKREVEF